MSQKDPFDPGYFGPVGQNGRNYQTPLTRSVRKPGFDAFTVIWPVLFMFIHIAISAAAQLLPVFIELFSNPELLSTMTDATSAEYTDLIMEIMFRDFALLAAVYSLIQAVVYFLFLRTREKREKEYFQTRAPRVVDLTTSVVAIVGCMGIAILWMSLVQFLAQSSDYWSNMFEGYQDLTVAFQADNLLLLTIGLSIMVPIAEELLFRGIILAELRRVAPPFVAALINGILFGVFHGNLIQGFYAAIAGTVLALAYIWTESIIVPIVMHMVYNFIGSVLPMMVGENEQLASIVSYIEIAFIALAIFAIVILYRNRRKPTKKPQPVGAEEIVSVHGGTQNN